MSVWKLNLDLISEVNLEKIAPRSHGSSIFESKQDGPGVQLEAILEVVLEIILVIISEVICAVWRSFGKIILEFILVVNLEKIAPRLNGSSILEAKQAGSSG